LAIVQGTVERHGGKVKVQSRVDEGTTFSMLLPGEGSGFRIEAQGVRNEK